MANEVIYRKYLSKEKITEFMIESLERFINASYVTCICSSHHYMYNFSMYETDPNIPMTYRNIELLPVGILCMEFKDTEEIKFLEAYADDGDIVIIYPENKMKGKEDEDLIHVLQNMILPDVFEILDIEIPGTYIKG